MCRSCDWRRRSDADARHSYWWRRSDARTFAPPGPTGRSSNSTSRTAAGSTRPPWTRGRTWPPWRCRTRGCRVDKSGRSDRSTRITTEATPPAANSPPTDAESDNNVEVVAVQTAADREAAARAAVVDVDSQGSDDNDAPPQTTHLVPKRDCPTRYCKAARICGPRAPSARGASGCPTPSCGH